MAELSDEILAPLTQPESDNAIAVAEAHIKPQLLHDGESRFRVLGAELYLTRALNKNEPTRREVEVLVIDYLGRQQLAVVVERDQVVEVRELEG